MAHRLLVLMGVIQQRLDHRDLCHLTFDAKQTLYLNSLLVWAHEMKEDNHESKGPETKRWSIIEASVDCIMTCCSVLHQHGIV